MGNYLNPGNSGFERIRNGEYVDKSGLISLLNKVMDTPRNMTCVSRPRRFGKSFAAQMLCAYYDRSCDSSTLFDDLKIASDQAYSSFRNKLNVIYLDMTAVIEAAGIADVVPFVKRNITDELVAEFPDLTVAEAFHDTLSNAAEQAGAKFFFIIDEWDAPIRESPRDVRLQKKYLEFLRALFKNSATTAKTIAGAYITGILPVKKDRSQSALSEFREYTMLRPGHFAPFFGFTEQEVSHLCDVRGADFELMKTWYDGYSFGEIGSIYNPSSVMEALDEGVFQSYWSKTSAADNLLEFIRLDYSGLAGTVAGLLGGIETEIDVDGFSNDLVSFRNKDDVLTLLVHLGYLSYNPDTKAARIPNKEVLREFSAAVKEADHTETIRRVVASVRLIEDTVRYDPVAVAKQIEQIHSEWPSSYRTR